MPLSNSLTSAARHSWIKHQAYPVDLASGVREQMKLRCKWLRYGGKGREYRKKIKCINLMKFG